MNNYITGNAIKILREKQKLTQSQLAEKLCVSDKTVSKWETGESVPDIFNCDALAQLYNVELKDLILSLIHI